jgi:hypothetical protein
VAASAGDPVLVQNIRARAATFGDGVAVIQPASPPSEPASPTPQLNALLAAAAVFLLSVGLAVRFRGSRKPAGPDRLAADVGGPILGQVPAHWFGSTAVPEQPGRAAYGMALQALRYRLRDAGDQSALLTAVGHDTSATSALLGLAAADAAQGHNVVLVDATPDGRLLRRAGVSASPVSLAAAVAGADSLDSALVTVPALAGPDGGSVRIVRVERTSVEALRRSLGTLRSSADLLLVDAGAAVHDPAAFALVGEVGAIVVVVRARRRSNELRELRRRLALAGRTCDGVLITHRSWVPTSGVSSVLFEAGDDSAPPTPPTPPKKAAAEPRHGSAEPSATAGRPV